MNENLAKQMSDMKLKVWKNKPIIALAISVASMAIGGYFTWKAGKKHDEVVGDIVMDIENVHAKKEMIGVIEEDNESEKETVYSEKDYRKELVKVYIKAGWALSKLYGPVVLFDALSLASGFTSYGELNSRNNASVAACAAVEHFMTNYRGRVKEALGEDADREFAYGIKEQKIDIPDLDKDGNQKIDKNGNPKTHKEIVRRMEGEFEGYSPYARVFDCHNTQFESNHDGTPNYFYNKHFLGRAQIMFTEKLQREHVLFLNEVYEFLGFEKTREGQVVGWYYNEKDPIGENRVDFMIMDFSRGNPADKAAFVNEEKGWVVIDFNVDGNVLEYL